MAHKHRPKNMPLNFYTIGEAIDEYERCVRREMKLAAAAMLGVALMYLIITMAIVVR